MEGPRGVRFFPDPETRRYGGVTEPVDILMKVETHNHPTAISPFPGAATGAGGEIRDEGATGIGAKPKVGLTGFSVSNLRIPGFVQPWETDWGKPDRIVSALDIMIDGALGRGGLQQRIRTADHVRLLPYLRADRRAIERSRPHRARLPQAHHDRRWPGQHPPQGRGEARSPGRRAAGRARRPGHADRTGRRCRLFRRQRAELRGSRFRLGAARQSRDRTARAGSDRPLLGAGRRESDLAHPRRGCRWPVECRPRGDGAQPPRRARRSAQDPERRAGALAAGDLVQRGAGALRARDRAGQRRAFRRSMRARALSLRGDRRDHRGWGAARQRCAVPDGCRSTCRSRCCSASRRAWCGPCAASAAARPALHRRHRPRGVARAPAASAHRRRQVLSDHDRRPHRRRPRLPRPDGRSMAGPGGGRGGEPHRLRRLSRRGDGHGRARSRGAPQCAGVRSAGRRRGHHQHHGRGRREARRRSAVGQLDGRLRRPRRGRGAVRHGAHGRPGTVPGARHRHSGGQGFAVDAHRLDRGGRTRARWSRRCR